MDTSSDSPAVIGSGSRRGLRHAGHRPHGIKYSLTLNTPGGERLYGLDNAHKIHRRREFDHRHVYGARKLVGYTYRGPARLLEDFYREVERILSERGDA